VTARVPRHRVLLAAIVAAGAAARFWGLGWGLPHTLAHPDETKFVSVALGFGYGDLDPHWFGYPTLFFYLAAAAFAVLYAAGRLTGHFPTLSAFKLQFFLDPTPFHLATRAISAVAGTLTILVAYRLGRELGGRAGGLVAALLVALNPLHARTSHFGNTDATMVLFAAAGLLWALRAARTARTRDLVLAGACVGLAASTKYPAALFAVALPVAALVPAGARAVAVPLAGRLRGLACGVLATGAAFALTSPFVLLDWRLALSDLRVLAAQQAGGWPGDAGAPAWLYHLTFSGWYGLGWPFYPALVLAAACLVMRRDRKALLLAAACLAYVGFMGAGRLAFARYLLPLVPPLAALVGALAAAPSVARLGRGVAGRLALAVALAVLLVLPAWRTLGQAVLFGRADTRALAREWIMAHVPSGATVVWLGAGFEFSRPELPRSRGEWERLLAHGDRPSMLGARDQRARWRAAREMLAMPGFPPVPNYALVEAPRLADVPSEPGAPVYVVVPEHPLDRFAHVDADDRRALAARGALLWETRPIAPGAAPVFERHDAIFLPLAGFGGVARPGPGLRIYRLG
jgi:4-amino-4-deoxy-L-arabinose transferase-like glycosyltransferase